MIDIPSPWGCKYEALIVRFGLCILRQSPLVLTQSGMGSGQGEQKRPGLPVYCIDGNGETIIIRNDMFETKRLLQALQGTAKEPLDKIIDHVKARLLEFMGTAVLTDDLLMIAMKIK